MSFDDYCKVVVDEYHKRREEHLLSIRLTKPTPGGFKRECLAVLENRFDRKDEYVLQEFFGAAENETAYRRLVVRHDTDKFRPLCKYLRGETADMREEVNIELLAWLINFRPRPFFVYKKLNGNIDNQSQDGPEKVPVSNPESLEVAKPPIASTSTLDMANSSEPSQPGQTPVIILLGGGNAKGAGSEVEVQKVGAEENESQGIDDQETQTTEKKDSDLGAMRLVTPVSKGISPIGKIVLNNIITKLRSRKAIIVTALIACSCAIIILFANRNEIAYSLGGQKWMYWAGDRYQLVSDSHKRPNTSVIAFDQDIMDNFRRITRIDTISERSVNVVYCSKKNNEYEYFTSNGYGRHPIDPFRNLKPLSRYIWERYLKPKPNLSPGPQ